MYFLITMVHPVDKGVYYDKSVLQTIIFICEEQTKWVKPVAANQFCYLLGGMQEFCINFILM